MGDMVRVTGFYNEAPQFAYVRRKNVLLSVDVEKTDEACLHQAIQNAAKLLKYSEDGPWNLLDYTSCIDANSVPGHYVIFWEIGGVVEPIPALLLEDCCLCVEESLDTMYRQLQSQSMSIGPLEIRVVQSGTFDAIMNHFVSQGVSVIQYKTPRCNISLDVLRMLDAKVLQASRSPRSPSWAPSPLDWIPPISKQP